MREFVIEKGDEGRKLERFLIREMPLVGMGARQKYFRLKRYKLNGHPAKADAVLHAGDVLSIYLNDAEFEKPAREDPFLSRIKPELDIIYEDENLLVVDKRPGLAAHPDAHEKVNTLLTHAQAYLYKKRQYDPSDKNGFAPALCNRIDRFTGGIVLIAKTLAALKFFDGKLREREIGKFYYCIVLGVPKKKAGLIDNYIIKAPDAKKVRVSEQPEPHAQRAQTRYRVLCSRGGLSLVECELLTGRTHQIRAQMAHMGNPILGDDQYGDKRANERFGRHFQALYAYRLRFDFESDAGEFAYLNGREFRVRRVRFIEEYFPDFKLCGF